MRRHEPVILKKAPDTLPEMLDYLHLPMGVETYQKSLAAAGRDNISHEEFLKRFLSQDAAAKFERQVTARLRDARFPATKTLDGFDWTHPTSIPKATIIEAFELRFLEKNERAGLHRQPRPGKTHLALSLGHRAARAGVTVPVHQGGRYGQPAPGFSSRPFPA